MIVDMRVHLYNDGWQPTFIRNPQKFYTMLREALDLTGPWRVMYGTDNPYLKIALSSRDWVQAVKDAPNSYFSFSKEEIDIMLGGAPPRACSISHDGNSKAMEDKNSNPLEFQFEFHRMNMVMFLDANPRDFKEADCRTTP